MRSWHNTGVWLHLNDAERGVARTLKPHKVYKTVEARAGEENSGDNVQNTESESFGAGRGFRGHRICSDFACQESEVLRHLVACPRT